MSWFNRFFKKKGPSPVVSRERQNRPKIVEYPKSQYKAYWEVLMHHDSTGARQQGVGVVRFYSYDGGVLSYSTFQGENDQELGDKIFEHVVNQMSNYKR